MRRTIIRKEEIAVTTVFLAICAFYSVIGIGCPIKWLTGISCAGCGMTRAVLCAVRLRFREAFYYHPMFGILPVCAAAFFFRESIPEKVKKYMAWSVIACFLTVYVWRLFDPDCQVITCCVDDGLIVRLWNHFKD